MKRNFILALYFSAYSCSELKGGDQINENNENSMVTKGWGNWKVINICFLITLMCSFVLTLSPVFEFLKG